MKLSLQGHTIVFASGDQGVGQADPTSGCYEVDNHTVFNPTWPASCVCVTSPYNLSSLFDAPADLRSKPWVTAVGATEVYPGFTVFEPESAAQHGTFKSGGGFSNVFPSPGYQAAAVATYFSEHNPSYPYYTGDDTNGGLYNRSGRGKSLRNKLAA